MTLPPVDETSLVAIMKLQENLHWGVGRDRKLASIGVYDLSAISGDITYRTIDPDKEPFVPLGMPGKKMTGRQILESHPKGVAYAELLANHKRYPVLVDTKNQVLSMPPIINSEETKLKQGTTRIFIDVTGISQAAVTKSLDTLVCSLAEIGGTIETVSIIDADGKQPHYARPRTALERDRRRRSETLARSATRQRTQWPPHFEKCDSMWRADASNNKSSASSALLLPRLPYRHSPHGRSLRRRRHRLRLRQHRAAPRPLDDRRRATSRRVA